MRVMLKDLMTKLGVPKVLGSYETYPWSCYNAALEITCSAEVRMGPGEEDLEAEIQIMKDIPPETGPPVDQICLIRATPQSGGLWGIVDLRIKGKPLEEEVYDWEGKSCELFKSVIQDLAIDTIPDFDKLIEDIIFRKERMGSQRGGGGGKKPKVKGGSLLGMKKGGGGI